MSEDRSQPLHTARWLGSRVLRRLEYLVVADGHAGRGVDGFGGNEFCGVAFEVVDAVDEGSTVNCFGGVRGWRGGCEFFQKVGDMGTSDRAGLT